MYVCVCLCVSFCECECVPSRVSLCLRVFVWLCVVVHLCLRVCAVWLCPGGTLRYTRVALSTSGTPRVPRGYLCVPPGYPGVPPRYPGFPPEYPGGTPGVPPCRRCRCETQEEGGGVREGGARQVGGIPQAWCGFDVPVDDAGPPFAAKQWPRIPTRP
jgi:hypothetical protein